MKKEAPIDPVVKVAKPSRVTGWVAGLMQCLMMGCVVGALVIGGFLLFRRPFLERYIKKQTGYPCQIEGFDFDPRKAMIELHDVTIWNIAPYPAQPLAKVRRIRMEWNPAWSKQFPRRLRLLEVEVDTLTLIRLDGNKFNVLSFVEALIRAWGSELKTATGESGAPEITEDVLLIDECWLIWDYLVAIDEEVKGGKRMEVLLEYEASHKHVSRIREITDPAIKVAREEVDTFYFFNYLGDSLRSLLN